jgi:hypothetical protein
VPSSLLAALVLALSLAGTVTAATPAAAADLAFPPPTPQFDRGDIDNYENDADPTSCNGAGDQPGPVAFRAMILDLYPSTGRGNIYRCDSGSDASDHKEGRAWDWIVNAGVPAQKAIADRVIDGWLLAPDDWGNQHAMLRRLGIKYIIWNRRIWSTNTRNWQTYSCDGTPNGCHTNHVHFSFTRRGARKQTSWWHAPRVDGPGAAASGNRVDVAVRGTDGQVYLRSFLPENGSWSAWQALGGYAKAGPAAVWWSGQLHIFVRGADDWIFQRIWSSGSGWGPWVRRFGPVRSQPFATTYNGALHVLARQPNTSNTLHWWWTGSSWASENLGGGSNSGPSARQYNGQFQVAIRGTDNHVYHRFYDGGATNTWRPWADLGGGTFSKPEAVSISGALMILVRGTDGNLYQRTHTHAGGWGGWGRLGSTIIRSAPAAVTTSNGQLHIFANDANGNVLVGNVAGFFANLGGVGI